MVCKSEVFTLLQSSIKYGYILIEFSFFSIFIFENVSSWFQEEREKSRRPLSTSDGPRSPLNNVRMRPKDSKVESTQSWAPSPCSPRCFVQDQPTPPSLGNNFRISGESKPPFVVRHVSLKLFFRVWKGEGANEGRIREGQAMKTNGQY